ncbi:MAG TPA: GNAT family N-acetyltransferase [Clostridiaceae bacterium]|nr:GNAT family N-acetyltransferase [Clostridiaceae bacterium]
MKDNQFYSFNIRKATVEDAEAIHEITREAFTKYKADAGITSDVAALTETVDDIIEDILKKHVFIAFIDNEPVGCVRVEILPDKTALITRFGVKTKYSNNGVGKTLINVVDRFLSEKGVKRAGLYTASRHTALINFYYARGFHVDSILKDKGYARAFMVKEYE